MLIAWRPTMTKPLGETLNLSLYWRRTTQQWELLQDWAPEDHKIVTEHFQTSGYSKDKTIDFSVLARELPSHLSAERVSFLQFGHGGKESLSLVSVSTAALPGRKTRMGDALFLFFLSSSIFKQKSKFNKNSCIHNNGFFSEDNFIFTALTDGWVRISLT